MVTVHKDLLRMAHLLSRQRKQGHDDLQVLVIC